MPGGTQAVIIVAVCRVDLLTAIIAHLLTRRFVFVCPAAAAAAVAAIQVLSVTGPALDAATPVIKDAAVKVFEFAAPVASEGFERAQKALSEAGVDTTGVIQAAKVRGRMHTRVFVQGEDRNGVTGHSIWVQKRERMRRESIWT